MRDEACSHRSGVLLVDESGLLVVDLDHGQVRRLDGPLPAPSEWGAFPELAPVPGADAAPVPAIPVRSVSAPAPEVVALPVPVALRLDGGRVLCWDEVAQVHVELTPVHLELLRRCGAGMRWVDLVPELGPAVHGAVPELSALGLLGPATAPAPSRRAPAPPAAVPADLVAVASGPVPVAAARSDDGRVPVIPLYRWSEMSSDADLDDQVEPSLSIGMLFAAARAHDGGRLAERYDLRRMQVDPEAELRAWEADPRPAVFVFSDYLWNLDVHLAWSDRVKAASPESICVHGGPSVPKYEDDAARFLAEHPSVDVAARGEGEVTFAELLAALDGATGQAGLERLRGVEGLTVRLRRPDGSEELVRNGDRDRLTDLDVLPSPFLTGEFDDLLSKPWRTAPLETNRGCPYGCTFCDWGSATLSRVRKFDLDRVRAELDWIFTRAAPAELFIADANVGIYERDVDIAEHIAGLRQRLGAPEAVVLNLAKNTAKYSKRIITTLVGAGVQPVTASAAVQSFDPVTLVAVRRQNISLDKYDEIAATFHEVGIPLSTDLLMGLPGSTVASFCDDLQACFDKEVTPRTGEIVLLPNSPMNDPEYRREHQIRVDEDGIVVGASSYTADDYEQMRRIRLLFRAADHFGVLRHVLRFLQWDLGLRALDVLVELDRVVTERPGRYPLLSYLARVFDLYTVPPVGWRPFYDEFVGFLGDSYDLTLTSDLAAVLTVQWALMPSRGDRYPLEVDLAHDFVAYRQDHLAARDAGVAHRPLASYGPGSLVVDDPASVSRRFVKRNRFPGRRTGNGNLFWMGYDWELDSPLLRHLATNVGRYDPAPV